MMYTMKATKWPGLGKLVEESGELNRILGKIIVNHGEDVYWEDVNLLDEVEEELADTIAASIFFIEENCLNKQFIEKRILEKLAKYEQWKENNE